jgi:hypothetical protein
VIARRRFVVTRLSIVASTPVAASTRTWLVGSCIALGAAVLSACGGGSSGGGSPAPTSPSNAPAIVTNPESISVAAGAVAAFSVVASGSAPLSYQWQRNGSDIAGANSSSYSTPPTSASDSGALFRVVVSNPAGSLTSIEATLTVSPSAAAAGAYFLLGEAGSPAPASTFAFFDGTVPAKRYPLVGVSADGLREPVTIEPGGSWAEVLDASWIEGKLSGDQWTTYRVRYRAYVKGNRFHILDQQTSSPNAAPQLRPWTTLKPAEVCRYGILPNGMTSVEDTVDSSKSYLFMREPGADRSCGTSDDVVRALRVNMSESDAALIVDEPVVAIRADSEEVSGFLTRTGNQVRRVDANFANPVNAFTLRIAATPSPSFVDGSSAPGTWFFVDGPGIYAYRLDGSTALTLIESLAAGEQVTAAQSSRGKSFWAITGPTATRVIGVNEALEVSTIGTLPETPTEGLRISSTHLVFKTGNAIRSMPKNGGSAALLVAGDPTWSLGSPWLSGDTVYITAISLEPIRMQVRIVGADGSNPQTIDNARTFVPIPASRIPKLFAADRLTSDFDTVVTLEDISNPPYLAGARLRAYDGATRSLRVNYGALPSTPSNLDLLVLNGLPSQFGGAGLLQMYSAGGYGASALDLIYFNSGSAGLRRLTSNLP